jgi:hypothetical protein
MNPLTGNERLAAVEALPEVFRATVSLWLEHFAERTDDQCLEFLATARKYPALLNLVACSEFAGKVLMREWRWFREFAVGDTMAGGNSPDRSIPATEAGSGNGDSHA